MSKLSTTEAARALGAKEREVREIVPAAGGGSVVTTHDGTRSLVNDDGEYVRSDRGPRTATLAPSPVTPAVVADALSQPFAAHDPEQRPAPHPGTGSRKTGYERETASGEPTNPIPTAGEGDGASDGGDAGAAATTAGAVPEGSAEQVLAWVGEDRARASQALAAEQTRPQPRSVLVTKLGKLSGGSA